MVWCVKIMVLCVKIRRVRNLKFKGWAKNIEVKIKVKMHLYTHLMKQPITFHNFTSLDCESHSCLAYEEWAQK